MLKKCTLLWREAHFEVKSVKKLTGSEHFWTFRCRLRVAGARDCAPCQKWAKPEGFLWFSKISKNDGGRGTFEEDLERWIFRGRRSIDKRSMSQTCSNMLGGPGSNFLRGAACRSIRSLVFGRWFCVTGAALSTTWHHLFVAGAILQRHGLEKSQNALVRGCQLCGRLSMFEGSFSQNCFVFDVANFKNWGSLAELLRFWCCQLQKLRKSGRIASFSSLQIDR